MTKRHIVYITGLPGSGKSTVCEELKRRGYEALDTDNDLIAFFYNNETGEPVKANVPSSERTPEWRKQHTWKAKRETVERLSERAGDTPLFLCGVTANDTSELWDLFSMVFALIVEDQEELKKRVLERDEDGYGKNPHELAMLMEWQENATDEYRKLGAVIVDASRPVDESVNSILEQTAPLTP